MASAGIPSPSTRRKIASIAVAPMGVKNALLQSPVPQDFPGELDQIQRPKPFDVGLRLNVVDDHLAENLIFARVLAWKQEGRLRKRFQFSGSFKRPARRALIVFDWHVDNLGLAFSPLRVSPVIASSLGCSKALRTGD